MGKPQFEWDEQNEGHLARHGIAPVEAEQVIHNRPVDLSTELRDGEERLAHIGETDAGRILVIVVTPLDGRTRVVTGWPANKSYRRYFLSLKRSGNVGRIEEDELCE
jgi:uncharacterized DUF497 family protein